MPLFAYVIVVLSRFSSLARSAREICSTEEAAGIIRKNLMFENSPSLLQTNSFMQSTVVRKIPFHVPEKCLKRHNTFSNRFSLGEPATYVEIGPGVAGPQEEWNIGGAKGKGLEACLKAVMASPRCNKDYFTYVHGGDKNCGCKGAAGNRSVRLSRVSTYYSIEDWQNCCSATTQEAACLDGYQLQWTTRYCGHLPVADSSISSLVNFGIAFANLTGAANVSQEQKENVALKPYSRFFECVPSPVDDNGALEEGLPGTVHRRRWTFNKDGDEGKTGSCCSAIDCSACEEKFTITDFKGDCGLGLGEERICASQHR